MVGNARPKYKTTDHPYRIRFTQYTRVKQVVPEPENFPLIAHKARPFDVLALRRESDVLLSGLLSIQLICLHDHFLYNMLIETFFSIEH
jgi:hypothetical protein